MADKTTGELKSIRIENLPIAPDIYDDLKMPGEINGDAVHITGAQLKKYAQSATKSFSESASKSATIAEEAKTSAQSALVGVREALNNLPEGDTLVINDLTTGGTAAALSAEMGKALNRIKLNNSDKPAGTYVGTGDTAVQVIDTKGTGKGIFIYGGGMGALVSPNGCICWYTSIATVTTLPNTQVAFANGKLTIATNSDFVNRSGVNYAYQVF